MAAITRRMKETNISHSVNLSSSLISAKEVDEAANKWKNCLIGKIISKDDADFDGVQKDVNIIWRKYRRVEIHTMSRNMYVFKFKNEDEVEDVLKKVLWIMDFNMVVLQKYDASIQLKDYSLTHQVFSVLMSGLALEHLDRGIIDKMCSDIGRRIDEDSKPGFSIRGRMVNARIEVDLRKPLKRGVWLLTATKQRVWVKYHFEKQPKKICTHCFVLDHNEEECEEITWNLFIYRMTEKQFADFYAKNEHKIHEMM
ncbi:uncharacterized protein LOC113312305 [Papaver somniferum]|uniref:uncharacterized protein LOC113312305 n=1 Tax=Papaver somniferum TaxID=3469 RepID=UPI000E703D8A|nr:uncharacterized protein LOC113312305 [Papaver somniferum]